MREYFCTYFDHNYLARGLLTIESLRAACPQARILVLALSEPCRAILEALHIEGVETIDLADVEAAFPALALRKADRSAVEYIFTLTPFLPQYCLDQDGSIERITYIDGDLYFYDSVAPIFDAIADRSIAIIPHRFSPDRLDDRKFGEFNVGWVTFRRSPAGLACLADYQASVLEWCHDRVEDGKFADQKYLDAWPETYPDLAIIMLKGANVALWNVDNYALAERPHGFLVDDEKLIFYHFHGIRQLPDGNFSIWLPKRGGAGETLLRRRIYRPYVARLMAMQESLTRRFPTLAKPPATFMRGPDEPVIEAAPACREAEEGWREDPSLDGWRSDFVTRARVLSGYAANMPPVAAPLIRAQLAALSRGGQSISVLELGGGLGDLALACADPWVDWHILEVPSVCDHGAVLRPSLHFLDDAATAFGRRYDLVIACGALHYLRDWAAGLRSLAESAAHRLVLLEVPVIEAEDDMVVVEQPPAFGGRATMQSWLIARPSLDAALTATGLATLREEPEREAEPVPGMPGRTLVGRVLVRPATALR